MQDDATGVTEGLLAGKRIGLLTASASRLGGGVFEAVAVQAETIRSLGGEAVIFALTDSHAADDRHRLAPSEVRLADVVGPKQIGFAPGLVSKLLAADLDCLHLHGIWMYPSRAATVWAKRTGRHYLISPHGMLDPWITARGRWKKVLARAGYERASWRAATAFHALTGNEAADIVRESGRADSIVIPNAGPPVTVRAEGLPPPIVLSIGRIHSKKNLGALVDAWAMMVAGGSLPEGARLIIAGWGDPGDLAALEVRVATLPEVTFLGPVFGAAKADLLERARFTVLPSLSEGLPMAVLESWAAGVPTLMSRASHLPLGFAAGAAFDCGTEPDAIAETLGAALALGSQRWEEMSEAALGLARGPFAASTIAARWGESYAALMETRP